MSYFVNQNGIPQAPMQSGGQSPPRYASLLGLGGGQNPGQVGSMTNIPGLGQARVGQLYGGGWGQAPGGMMSAGPLTMPNPNYQPKPYNPQQQLGLGSGGYSYGVGPQLGAPQQQTQQTPQPQGMGAQMSQPQFSRFMAGASPGMQSLLSRHQSMPQFAQLFQR